eukprot:1136345-Pelagomonas_calceolata.AAC.1
MSLYRCGFQEACQLAEANSCASEGEQGVHALVAAWWRQWTNPCTRVCMPKGHVPCCTQRLAR